MKNNFSVLKRLLRFTKPYVGFFITALLSALISICATLYAPVVIGRAIDYILEGGRVNFNAILPLIIELLIVACIAALFQWLMNFSTNSIANSTVRDMRNSVFSKLQRLPLSSIDSTPHGDIISRMVTDIDQISDGLLQGFTQLLSGIITILGTIGFMLSINIPLAAVVIIVTPLSLFVASFIAKRTSSYFRKQANVKGELSACVEEMVGGIAVVKSFGNEARSNEKLKEINQRLYDCGVKAQFYSSLTNPCTRFVNSMVYASVGIVGAISVSLWGLSIGMLSTFLAYANQYTKPFNEITGVITELQTALASARRVFELLDSQDEIAEALGARVVKNAIGEVSIENVSFSYTQEKKLIENLNVFAKSGQRIAIVGPTGCGKTTIINLLMRFYDINQGKISVDNTDIRDLTRDSLRQSYGMVLQDTWLFNGTVRDNIAYGKPSSTNEEIISAAKSAHAHSFIKRLQHGYDTVMTEDGGNISQGQKQLLCIARVMLTNPPMLILDEATSSIDTMTEIRVQKAFSTMMQGKTSFIVAHRLSTIKEADCILVMRDGNIVEQGRHDELMSENGFYCELYNSQFKKS